MILRQEVGKQIKVHATQTVSYVCSLNFRLLNKYLTTKGHQEEQVSSSQKY